MFWVVLLFILLEAKKIIIIITTFIVVCFGAYKLINLVHHGSSKNVEAKPQEVSSDALALIQKIQQERKDNPGFFAGKPWNGSFIISIPMIDGKRSLGIDRIT